MILEQLSKILCNEKLLLPKLIISSPISHTLKGWKTVDTVWRTKVLETFLNSTCVVGVSRSCAAFFRNSTSTPGKILYSSAI